MNVQKLKLGLPSLSSDSIQEQSEAEFRAMTNAVPAIIWGGNANGDKVYLNDRWYERQGE